MVGDRCERYEISHVGDDVLIVLWEVLPRVGVGVIALVLLAAGFMTDPYEGHGRIWVGLGVGVAALALVALFGVRIENWTISGSAVRYKGSLWSRELSFERVPGSAIQVRLERVPSDVEGNSPPFPHVVHLFDGGGNELGDGFRFRERSSVDRFLESLQTNVTVALERCAELE